MNNPILVGEKCPYCSSLIQKVDSSIIYGKSYGMVYICQRFPICDAYVGCHRRSGKPLGRLANKELRAWKVNAHDAFDPLWKSGDMTRTEAYSWLAGKMEMDERDCHIGMFDVKECREVVRIMKEFYFTEVGDFGWDGK